MVKPGFISISKCLSLPGKEGLQKIDFFMLRKRPLYLFQKIYIAGLQLLIHRTKRSVIFFGIRTERV